MSYQRVKYKLLNKDTNTSVWLEHDPINWDSSEKTLKRSTKTFGVYTELSKDLVFVKDGANFLKDAELFRGSEADVELYEYRFNPSTSHPYLHSTGTFDFSEYKYNSSKKEVKVPFKSGGLNALIQAQIKEKFEIERLESINGNEINEVVKKLVALTSRKILLVSKLETNSQDAISTSFRMKFSDGNHRTGSLAIPLEVTSKSDDKLGTVIRDFSFTTTPNEGSSIGVYYFNNDLTKTLETNIKVYCKVKRVKIDDLDNGFLKVDLVKFNNGTDLDLVERTTLYNVPMNQVHNHIIDIDYSENIVLQQGESLALQWYGGGNFGGSLPGDDGYLRLDFEETEATIDIVENSERQDSQTYAILMRDIGEKLMQIITGEKGRYYSDYFTNGDFKNLALTLGFWIRQFYYEKETVDDIETSKYAMELSLDNFLNTTKAVCLTGYGIEVISGQETLVHEDLKYFFQDAIAIDLPNQVTKLEYSTAKEFCNSSLLFGYKKGGEYEEAMGLDEYNVRSGFTMPITRVDTTYKAESDARADKYAQEFARRKPRETYPTTDTSYDKDLHLLDLKEGLGEALEERDYKDDFSEIPKNVYSPETATNLRLTPSSIEERHQWFYSACLDKQQDKKVRYSNGDGNKSLITTKTGKTARAEKDDLNVSDLENYKFVAKWATFEHPITYNINQQLNGKTNVNGREVPNVYFKVQFVDDEGKKQIGYLFEQKKQGADLGKFKLLMAV